MECDICRCHEWVRHCPSCGGDFCDECSSNYVQCGVFYCPNGCDEILDLYPETIPDEDEEEQYGI